MEVCGCWVGSSRVLGKGNQIFGAALAPESETDGESVETFPENTEEPPGILSV